MKRVFISTFFVLFSFLLVVTPASSQTKYQKREDKVFAAIPENLRERLIERLNLYVEYQRTKQYEKLYDLLLESVKTDKSLGRDGYVNVSEKAITERHRQVLLKFKPTSTLNFSLDDKDVTTYQIFGIGKVDDGKDSYQINAVLNAYLIKNEWYFSEAGTVIYD